jgi:hypothetical protein
MNDEIRMTNDESMTRTGDRGQGNRCQEMRNQRFIRLEQSKFVIRASSLIRHLSFVIRHSNFVIITSFILFQSLIPNPQSLIPPSRLAPQALPC